MSISFVHTKSNHISKHNAQIVSGAAHSAAIDVSEANGEPDIVWLVAMIATAVLAVSTQNSRYDKPYRLLPTNSICRLHFQIAAPSVRFDL